MAHQRVTKPNVEHLGLEMLVTGKPFDVEASERAGGQEMLNSISLPVDTRPNDQAFIDLGFVFGEPYEDDPIFRDGTLPDGWLKQDAEHHYGYWTYIVDDDGRERASIFYKAAFYDRNACMYLSETND